MGSFKVGNLLIGGPKTILIAEAGVNHLKKLEYAEKLIESAASAGADIVKFQTYAANKLTTRFAPRFWDWAGEPIENGSQHDSYKLLETPDRTFTQELLNICRKHDVEFMSTPFDLESASMLNEIGSPAFKIASCDITNLLLLRKVASFGKPIFLSTGAAQMNEIKRAVFEIAQINSDAKLCIMHCTLSYPTRPQHANLSAIDALKLEFPGAVIGLSDHTLGVNIAGASPLLGCKVIEKHYTFDKTLPDSADHWLSVDTTELSDLRKRVDEVGQALGDGGKYVLECEELARTYARRSLVAKHAISQGEKFTHENVISKRPGIGISPVYYDEIIGLTATQDIGEDTIILPKHVREDASFKLISREPKLEM